ncbi:MAG: SGNH/GDSL hydrolase family protein [Candidatus Saccharimonadales bacterium]
MFRHSWYTRLALLVAAVLGTTSLVLVVSPAQPAHAGVKHVATLTDIYVNSIYTHGNGMATLNRCRGEGSQSATWVKTIDGLGNTITQVPQPSSWNIAALMCNDGAVAADGTIFTKKRSGGDMPIVAAYKNNELLWQYHLGTCAGYPYSVREVQVGADGDVYVMGTVGCNGSDNPTMFGIDAQSGQLKFKKVISTPPSPYNYWRFGVHATGLVVFDEPTLRYFDYDGVEDTSKTYTLPTLPSGQIVAGTTFDVDGDVFFAIRQNKASSSLDPCTARQDHIRAITKRSFNGTVSTFDMTPLCITVPWYASVVTPDGGYAFVGRQMTSPQVDKLVKLEADGSVVTHTIQTTGLVVGNSNYPIVYYHAQVDLDGNIVVPMYGYKLNGDLDRMIKILVYDAAGNQTFSFSTDEIGASSREYFHVSTDGSLESKATPFGLSPGSIHAAVCRNTFNSSQCDVNSNPQKLYKIDAPVTIDYPRGLFMGYQPGAPAPKKMVAAGDSYISGEGVPDFLAGTDIDNSNECHRSKKAYPLKLDYNPALHLNLVSFPACSGATTQNITGAGQWGEPKQLDAVPTDADVIVLSIGGNDIDFANGMLACTLTVDAQVCENTLSVINSNVHAPGFEEKIEDTYAAIATKAPNALVIAVGYPMFMGLPGQPHCDWLLHSMTSTEENLVDDIGTTLNSIIETEAIQAGFTFVPLAESFGEHTMCSSTPWVNGVDLQNEEYSYHPNAAGVQKIYELVMAALA